MASSVSASSATEDDDLYGRNSSSHMQNESKWHLKSWNSFCKLQNKLNCGQFYTLSFTPSIFNSIQWVDWCQEQGHRDVKVHPIGCFLGQSWWQLYSIQMFQTQHVLLRLDWYSWKMFQNVAKKAKIIYCTFTGCAFACLVSSRNLLVTGKQGVNMFTDMCNQPRFDINNVTSFWIEHHRTTLLQQERCPIS